MSDFEEELVHANHMDLADLRDSHVRLCVQLKDEDSENIALGRHELWVLSTLLSGVWVNELETPDLWRLRKWAEAAHRFAQASKEVAP